jgi:predicted phage tail protein
MFDEGVDIVFRNGSQDQSSIPGFDDVRIEQSLGTASKEKRGAN